MKEVEQEIIVVAPGWRVHWKTAPYAGAALGFILGVFAAFRMVMVPVLVDGGASIVRLLFGLVFAGLVCAVPGFLAGLLMTGVVAVNRWRRRKRAELRRR